MFAVNNPLLLLFLLTSAFSAFNLLSFNAGIGHERVNAHKSVCVSWHPRLRTGEFLVQNFTACMTFLMETCVFGLGNVSCTVCIPYLISCSP